MVTGFKLNASYLMLSAISILFLLLEIEIGFYITKPFIVLILIIYLFKKFKELQHKLIPLLMVATFFSFLGDVLLLITIDEAMFKLFGICTFTVAQAAYAILYYLSTKNKKLKNIALYQRWPEFLAVGITILTVIMIYPSLGDFAVLGLIYAFITSLTIIFALNRRFFVDSKSFWFTFSGVISFFISDALMGDDLFFTKIWTHAMVMIFYVIGHFLVINGMMSQVERETKKAPKEDAFF